MVYRNFAQVTGVPPSGASNATDFQPQTRNPQQAPSGLQQGGSLNGLGSDQDILTDNPNAKIIVPVNPADPQPQTLADTTGGGINWLLVMVALVAIAGVAFAWVQSYRGKKGAGIKMYDTVPEATAHKSRATDSSRKSVQTSEKPEPAKPAKTATPKSTKPKTKKKTRKQRRK